MVTMKAFLVQSLLKSIYMQVPMHLRHDAARYI